MNRRKLLNFLASATVGTIIALKLPNTIAPINEFGKPRITLLTLSKAIRSSYKDFKTLHQVMLSGSAFRQIKNDLILSGRKYLIRNANNLIFQGVEIYPSDAIYYKNEEDRREWEKHFDMVDMKENEIHTIRYKAFDNEEKPHHIKRYLFV